MHVSSKGNYCYPLLQTMLSQQGDGLEGPVPFHGYYSTILSGDIYIGHKHAHTYTKKRVNGFHSLPAQIVKKVPEGEGLLSCDVTTLWGRGGSRRYRLLLKGGKAQVLRTSENILDDLIRKAGEE